jgi:hypothetical protein
MYFNPDIFKNYTNRQLDQLSLAGSNEDIGSSERIPDRLQSSGLSFSVFSRLLRRPNPPEEENVNVTTPSNDETDAGLRITELDESSGNSYSEAQSVNLAFYGILLTWSGRVAQRSLSGMRRD